MDTRTAVEAGPESLSRRVTDGLRLRRREKVGLVDLCPNDPLRCFPFVRLGFNYSR